MTLVGFALDAGERLKQTALEEFTHNTGIQVNVVPAWGTSEEQLIQTTTLLNNPSNPADICLIDVVWPGVLASDLLDLRSYVGEEAQAHLPALIQNDTVLGRLVSLPFYVNVGVLYYRTDLISKYGYRRPPSTWDELESMAARIQRGERAAGHPDFWGYVWQGAAYEGLTCDGLELQASYGGGRIIERNGSVSVNNPAAIAALQKATRWVGTISPKGVLNYNESDSLAVFRSGNAAFLRHWSGAVARARAEDSPIRSRFAVALLPAGPRGRAQAMGGFHLAVSRRTAYPREAAQLAMFLAGSKVQLRRALTAEYLPTIPRLYDDPQLVRQIPIAAELRDAGENAWVVRPSTITGSKYGSVSKAYYQAVHDILSCRLDAEDALSQLEHKLVTVTGFRAGPPQ